MARKTGSHAEITGPRIRAAALQLFAQHGYAAVSMRQIAGEVGVQAGALYTYISDKQALLFDLMRGHMEHLLGAWEAASGGGDPLERLEAFTRFHIRYHLDRPEEVFISYMELRNLEPDNFEALEALRRRYERELEQILADGQAAGLFTVGDTRVTTMGLIAMLTGISTWFRDGGRLSRADVEELYWEMTRRSVGAASGNGGPEQAAAQTGVSVPGE